MTTDPAARRKPSHGATAAILNGSPPTLTMGVMKLSEKLAIVMAKVRQNGGWLGSSAMLSHQAQALQRHTTPYSSRIGTNSQPVRTASDRSCSTPMRPTGYAKAAEQPRNSSRRILRLTRYQTWRWLAR